MPRGKGCQRDGHKKFHRKNYKHLPSKKRFKFGNKNSSDNKKATTAEEDKFKKLRHIQRSKESEQLHRKQTELEISMQQKMAKQDEDEDSISSDDDVDPMDQLLTSFQARAPGCLQRKRKAIESSDSSSEDENDAESEDQNIDENGSEVEEDEEDGSEEEVVEEKSENESVEKRAMEADGKSEDDNEDTEEEFDEEIERISSAPTKDMFSEHLDNLLSSDLLESINKSLKSETHRLDWPIVNCLQVTIPKADTTEKPKNRLLDDDQNYATEGTIPHRIDYKTIDLDRSDVKKQIQANLIAANKKNLADASQTILTPLQCELFSILNNYQDLYYPHRTLRNGEEIRLTYCLHVVNHILKTRTKILHHNAKLSKAAATESKSAESIPDSYRDHGLFRPKAIIIVPFKSAALHVINTIIALIFPQLGGTVMNHKKFLDEFTGDSLYFPKRNPKPEDYELTFAGNTDDMFRIGLCLTRKCLKLYSSFYASDIIVASPLGLRTIIGAAGEKDRDYDFLASIELLIVDQADVILAQNWDHLLHVLEHLHLQPKSARDTDFSRVRTWCLNGWSRFYRQSMLFATHDMPEFRSLFNSKCSNYRGKIRTINPITVGSIQHVAVPVPQVNIYPFNFTVQHFRGHRANLCMTFLKVLIKRQNSPSLVSDRILSYH